MIGLVMAGGKGSRMNSSVEKLLLKHKKPVILHVVDALRASHCFSKIIAITSKNSPKTKNLLKQKSVEIFDTSGLGYVEDLNSILCALDENVLVTSGDLPFLDAPIIQKIVEQYNPHKIWTSIVVTNQFLESIHLSSECSVIYNDKKFHYTGISLINAKQIKNLNTVKENYQVFDDKRVAFNLNTKQDIDLLDAS